MWNLSAEKISLASNSPQCLNNKTTATLYLNYKIQSLFTPEIVILTNKGVRQECPLFLPFLKYILMIRLEYRNYKWTKN